jgi:hypothetical protein
MVKDSKKYSSTGGWGYAHFNEKERKPKLEKGSIAWQLHTTPS